MDWKLRYDESDNPLIKASRLLTHKISDVVGGLFQKTELSETLTEICKIDNSFDPKQFLKQCEQDIIPNVLEAMTRGDLEILKDWCYEGPYNIFAIPLKEAMKKGYRIDSKILDIDNVDIVMGKVIDQGPVLIISFTSQQVSFWVYYWGFWSFCLLFFKLQISGSWKLLQNWLNGNK